MPSPLDHRDRRRTLDLHVLEEPQVAESALRREPDTEPVRPYPLRGADQHTVDVMVPNAGVGEGGPSGLAGELHRGGVPGQAGLQRHPGHPHPDDVYVGHCVRGFRSPR